MLNPAIPAGLKQHNTLYYYLLNVKLIAAIFFLLFFQFSTAQKEANTWYFGHYAGLDFSNGDPVFINDGKIYTNEGVATICDANGNLLFYTDGVSVWNRQHNLMPNGIDLFGDISSSQSSVVIPAVDDPQRYYIFTIDDLAGSNGLCYSVVNMSLDNGRGDVETKNTLLTGPPLCEKITAVKHCNGKDAWLITHLFNSDTFHAYLVTAAGISTTPVVSHAGRFVSGSTQHTVGYLKASPDGSRLAAAHNTLGLDLLDFNATTGIVSNAKDLFPAGNSYYRVYGVEFSPNSQLLYATVCTDDPLTANPENILVQYNLSQSATADIVNTRNEIYRLSWQSQSFGALQLGPDGRIYLAEYFKNYISVINEPALIGAACNFQYQKISLSSGHRSTFGLPGFMQTFLDKVFTYRGACSGDFIYFDYARSPLVTAVQWDFGDPASGLNNTSTLDSASHLFSAPGTYTVTLIRYSACGNDTTVKQITAGALLVDLGNDTTLCASAYLIEPTIAGNNTFIWQDNSTSSTYTATQTGTYWVEIKNSETGCVKRDSIDIILRSAPQFTLGNDVSMPCEGQPPVVLKPLNLQQTGNLSYNWQDGSTAETFNVINPGTYRISITNDCGSNEDAITVHASVCRLYFPSAFTPNNDQLNDIFRARYGENVKSFRLIIYNRWGQKMFETNDIGKGWDGRLNGKQQPTANYVWMVSYTTVTDPQKQIMKGSILLLR